MQKTRRKGLAVRIQRKTLINTNNFYGERASEKKTGQFHQK
jgi:hypothetical protein